MVMNFVNKKMLDVNIPKSEMELLMKSDSPDAKFQ